MTNDGNNTLVYDAENRVLSATNGGSSGTYTYDGNSLRVKKASGSTTTVYIFSGSKVIAEYDNGAAAGSPSREYIYSAATLLAKIDSSGTKYYHQDQLSNRVVTDSSGNILEQLGHYPFGESWYNASNDKLLFTSYERDSESGNDYAMARYNVNRLGRFASPDSQSQYIDNPQSLNRFAYVQNDPVDLSDPWGLDPCDNDPNDCVSVSADPPNESEVPYPYTGTLEPSPLPLIYARTLRLIANARVATYLAILQDPRCLTFLSANGDPLSTLTNVPIEATGYGGAGPVAAVVTIPTTSLSPNSYQININQSGPFVNPGTSYGPNIGGQPMASGSPRIQGFTLMHELGHITGAIQPDGTIDNPDMAAEAKNNAAIAANCKNALSSLSNTPPQ